MKNIGLATAITAILLKKRKEKNHEETLQDEQREISETIQEDGPACEDEQNTPHWPRNKAWRY